MELFVSVILLTVTGAQGSQMEGPQNTLSVVGSNVTLKCSVPSRNCREIEWLKYIPGTASLTVFKNGRVGISAAFRDRYSLDNSSGCDIVIKNVDLTDAGRFICTTLISSNTVDKSANLIILDTHPKCTTNASMNDTVEEDGLQLNCAVTYNGTASMVWKGVEDSSTAVKSENGKAKSRSHFVVASAPEVPSFTCIISFAVETETTQGLATNIPNTTCETPIVKVLYSVRNVTLSPSLSYYTSGNVINCTAKGHPSPTFKWQELENGSTWMDIQNQNGSEFSVSIVTSKRYRCVAMNVVRGKSYNATSHEFLVQSKSNNATSQEFLVQSKSNNATSQEFLVQSRSNNATSSEFLVYNTGSEFKENFSSSLPSTSANCLGIGIGIGFGIGLLVAILLATVAFAILVRLRYIELHPRPANKPDDGGAQCMDHEMNPSPRQRSAVNPSIARTEVPLFGDQESAYASLGEDRDANEYAALELRQKAKPKK